MNIEDLAKREENAGRKPVKKKGYDDVEFTDISVKEDDKKKDKQPKNTSKSKDVKDADKKKKDAAAPKKNEKQAAPKAKQNRAHAAGNDPADPNKKQPSDAEKNIQQKIVPLPKIVEKPSAERPRRAQRTVNENEIKKVNEEERKNCSGFY
ncbi:unnamed protein product [Haemonchus placei]|uniref:Translation initiation factor IF-2 n=1 Tax=Haemonchus placei TaxID=6290 RepID=A0A0N4WA73_HAEPC|nr:unnamed protein product [Haemonchus placei]